MWKRQSQSAPEPSRGEFVVDQPPNLIAINDRGMIQLGKPIEGKFALPQRMPATRNHDVVFLGERIHHETRRKMASVGEIADRKIKRSVTKFRLRHSESQSSRRVCI